MFAFILFILIVVLFIKVSNVNDRIDELTRRISQTTPTRQGYTQNTPIIKEEEKPFNPQNTEQEKREEQILSPQEKLENFLEPLIETKTETVQTKAEKINQTPKEEPTFKEYTNKKREAENAPFSTLSTNSILEEQTKEGTPSAVQFTAAKVFSWIAAFAFILAVIFGLIYAVQNNIISKQMITAAAGLIGLILLGTGLLMKDEKTKTAAATLCASGITTFFIATYCSFSLYNMINLPVAFVLMATISFVSFYISVKKDMQFISFLGMVAAFITPLLLSTENDNYIFFFTYIAFINGAAIAVSLKKGWNNLLASSLFFTFMCQIAWLGKDFNPQRVNIFQIIFTIYSIALTCTYLRLKNTLPLFIKYVFSAFIIAGAVMVLPLMACLDSTSFVLINLLILVTVSNALVLVLYYGEPTIFKVPAYIMGIVFLLSLFAWSHTIYATQTGGLLLLFAILGASLANSLVINSKTGESFSTVINLIALFLVFLMLMETNFKLENLSLVHNGTIIFNLALLAIAYKFKDKFTNALKTSLGSYIMASLLFSLLFTIQTSTQINFIVILVNVFIVNLSLLFLTFKEGDAYKLPLKFASIGVFIVLYLMLSVKAALMPFAFSAYLLLGTLNLFTFLHLAKKEEQNFALIFAAVWFLAMFNTTNMYYIWFAAGILNLVCLSLARVFKKPSLILIAALGSSLLFARAHDIYAVSIACIFFILFFAFPFLCKKDFKEDSCPQWVASVYMGLVAWFITIGYETFVSSTDKGLITLPFAALFLLNSGVLYRETQNNKYKMPFVIVSLTSIFFITAAISLFFANQMLTLALAAEGAALIVFNKKVPTNWNSKIGFVLLVIAVIRLIFIGKFSSGYTVDSKIFNWYMLVYSLSAAAMFVSAKYWVAEEKDNNTIKNILNIAGAVLLFFLVNIEIANYFSTSGELLKFNFFGDFASTITYTIAWTLYGAITCLIAFYNKHKTVLKIGIVIMILSIIKLFLFDLWSLGILYRIIGLFAIAGILFGISYIFQKFKDRLK